jgi:protein TonB
VIRHLNLVVDAPLKVEKSLASTPLKAFSVKNKKNSFVGLTLAQFSMSELGEVKKNPMLTMACVAIAHIAIIAFAVIFNAEKNEKTEEPTPMIVSLVSNPVPEHELVPLIAPPPKMQQKPIEKKLVKKIEQKQPEPVSKVQEQVVEQVVPQVEQEVVQQSNATNVVETPKVLVNDAPKQVEPELVVEPPKFGVAYLNNPKPNYPNMSKRLGEEGRVLLRVLVATDGKPETVELENSSGFERLDQAAIDVVKKWSFIPAKKGKEVLSAYVLVPVKFTLNQ